MKSVWKILIVLLVLMLGILGSCDYSDDKDSKSDPNTTVVASYETSANVVEYVNVDYSVEYKDKDLQTTWDMSEARYNTLEDKVFNITEAGIYVFDGKADDGQIVIDVANTEDIILILNNVELTCKSSAPIYVKEADKVVITLPEGSENTISDGNSYIYDNEEEMPDATIYSKGDITINGSGGLTINANFNDGIVSKDKLKILGGNITVKSVNNAIKGKDYVAINGGILDIDAGGNGIKSTNAEEANKGFILIENGEIDIFAEEDAIEAVTGVVIQGGEINVKTGGGSAAAIRSNGSNDMRNPWGQAANVGNASDNVSKKGVKADVKIIISGGILKINSEDDAIHTNNSLNIEGGDIEISAGDDGIHADNDVNINGGNINIKESYEGIEGAVITVNGGNISIVSDDDGINASNGSSSNSMSPQNGVEININGGYVSVNAGGDGFDSNGNILITNGTVIINGPSTGANGSLDANGTIIMNGGFLVAAGSSGMAEYPSTSSTQYIMNLSCSVSEGTIVRVEDSAGEVLLTFKAIKTIQSIVFSSSQLKNGGAYTVYTGGICSGTPIDGIYKNDVDELYEGGTKLTDFKISSIVTNVSHSGYSVGNDSGGFGQGGGGRRPGR